MPNLIVIAHNIRSTHNVGAIFRTCEGFGVKEIILSGYTPSPGFAGDTRLPHLVDKLTKQIHKTALGAETMITFTYQPTPDFADLKKRGYSIVGLEQNERSIPLQTYVTPKKTALLLGEEVEGIEDNLLAHCDDIIEIPMVGEKESFNVSVATGIALYGLTVTS